MRRHEQQPPTAPIAGERVGSNAPQRVGTKKKWFQQARYAELCTSEAQGDGEQHAGWRSCRTNKHHKPVLVRFACECSSLGTALKIIAKMLTTPLKKNLTETPNIRVETGAFWNGPSKKNLAHGASIAVHVKTMHEPTEPAQDEARLSTPFQQSAPLRYPFVFFLFPPLPQTNVESELGLHSGPQRVNPTLERGGGAP